MGCPHKWLLTSCVMPSSVRSPRVSSSSSLWGHRELWGSTDREGTRGGPQYSLLQRAQHHPTPGAMSLALHLLHPGDGLQRLHTSFPAAAALSPQHEAPVCPCSSPVGGQRSSWGTWPHTPPNTGRPITPLPGPTPMYCSARQYERLWVLRAPWGRALG